MGYEAKKTEHFGAKRDIRAATIDAPAEH